MTTDSAGGAPQALAEHLGEKEAPTGGISRTDTHAWVGVSTCVLAAAPSHTVTRSLSTAGFTGTARERASGAAARAPSNKIAGPTMIRLIQASRSSSPSPASFRTAQ